MNAKTLVLIFVAFAVGLCVGYLIWQEEAKTEATVPDTRGEWPMVPCPPGGGPEGSMAADVCDQITQLANQATPPSVESHNCAWKAQSKKSGNPPDPMAAAATLHDCLLKAQAGEWALCEQGLDTIPD